MERSMSNFDRAMCGIQKKFVENRAQDVVDAAQKARIASIVAAALACMLAIPLVVFAFAAMPTTLGFSALLLVPAAVCFVVVFDCCKYVNGCNIIIERGQRQTGPARDLPHFVLAIWSDAWGLAEGRPEWYRNVQKEFNSTLLFNQILNYRW